MMTPTQATTHLQAHKNLWAQDNPTQQALDMAIQALSSDPRKELLEMLIETAEMIADMNIKKMNGDKTLDSYRQGIATAYQARVVHYKLVLDSIIDAQTPPLPTNP